MVCRSLEAYRTEAELGAKGFFDLSGIRPNAGSAGRQRFADMALASDSHNLSDDSGGLVFVPALARKTEFGMAEIFGMEA